MAVQASDYTCKVCGHHTQKTALRLKQAKYTTYNDLTSGKISIGAKTDGELAIRGSVI